MNIFLALSLYDVLTEILTKLLLRRGCEHSRGGICKMSKWTCKPIDCSWDEQHGIQEDEMEWKMSV